MKAAQWWILENLLNPLPVHDAAHGFVNGRSIVTNASAHVGRDLVINWDLKNFFPTVTYTRVKGLFRSFGYSEKIATVLGLLCTEPDAEQVELDGEDYFVHSSKRHLPQGAPTSPAITNLLCRRFDARLKGIAEQLGFHYTRYADDLSFSASGKEAGEQVRKLLWRVQAVVGEEGFQVHPDKLRIMRKGGRQEVTGLTVNEKLGVPRDDLRRFRALVYQVEKDGPGGKKWRDSEANLLACLLGYANFICMVDLEKGAPIRDRVKAILTRHGWQHEIR
ncbi:MAG: reverse transcriptase family protein, partial [Boseongicola sp.]